MLVPRIDRYSCSYECFYIAAPNQLFTEGDGGFINVSPHSLILIARPLTIRQLSITHSDRCTFDSETVDLTCV
jgi:hypothetical protein